MSFASRLPRTLKTTITRALHDNLAARALHGPDEPGLDAFIPELAAMTSRLDAHVSGKASAIAARAAHAVHADSADIDVDTWTRHIESFLFIEGHRRGGAHVATARALHAAAFPEGTAFVDDRIPEENAQCREALAVLRAPENQAIVKDIGLPLEWLDRLEGAIAESEAAFAKAAEARGARSEHVILGKDAEADWVDLVARLRKHVESRARAGEIEKQAEGRALLAPLLDALGQAKAIAAARATRRTKKETPPPALDATDLPR
ncbi:hypothetical protein [Polyangium aurulentum]|uniref:hypothetical protein n=1 Tax=Polyangium aurulentum TaxID=2567896 RepID=UPI0010ADFF88|nr:hypothetical protein [Polyangium aurulentum]UQA55861.1 hypothetical protein E8A73_031605 [Polyangium aurulentum]